MNFRQIKTSPMQIGADLNLESGCPGVWFTHFTSVFPLNVHRSPQCMCTNPGFMNILLVEAVCTLWTNYLFVSKTNSKAGYGWGYGYFMINTPLPQRYAVSSGTPLDLFLPFVHLLNTVCGENFIFFGWLFEKENLKRDFIHTVLVLNECSKSKKCLFS